MKYIAIFLLALLLTGCAEFQKLISPQSPEGEHTAETSKQQPFQAALDQLLSKNDPAALQAFIKKNPGSVAADNGKRLLQLHRQALKCRSDLEAKSQQLDSTKLEVEKLQQDIDRLTRLNLELDRRGQ